MADSLNTRHRHLKLSVMICCVVTLISAIIVLSLNITSINNSSYDNSDYSKSIMKALTIIDGVLGMLVQLMGMAMVKYNSDLGIGMGMGMVKYNKDLRAWLAYIIISATLGVLSFLNAILYGYGGNWWLVVVYGTCVGVSTWFVRDIKRLRIQALNATGYTIGVVSGQRTIASMDVGPGKPVRDQRYRYAKWVFSGFCGVALTMTMVIMSVELPYLNGLTNGGDNGYSEGQIYTTRAIIITVSVISILTQFGGLWGAYKEYYYISVVYVIVSILLACLCVVSAIAGKSLLDWIMAVLFGISGCQASQLAYEIKRTNRMTVLNQLAHMNSGIQPNMVYMMSNTVQPTYMEQGGHGQSGSLHVTPEHPYGGSSTTSPTEVQLDISSMIDNGEPVVTLEAPGVSDSHLNENIEDSKTK